MQRLLQRIGVELLLDDLAILLLSIYSPNTKSLIPKNICTSAFIVPLSIIAKIWKLSKCPITQDRIRMLWYTDTMECHAALSKNNFMQFAAS